MANVADGATGTILTAPSPATSGTTVTLNAGEGYRFPAVPFFAIVHQNNTIPTLSSSEKVQVTAQGQTTIAVASNGASLPQSTINVVDASSLNAAGTVTIVTATGAQVVTYTGKTGTTLTGCTGGSGAMATGGLVMGDNFTIVRAISPYSAQSLAVTWRFSNAIFANDLNNASMVRNEVPVGSVNGSNTAFTTASQFQTKSLMVYKNGIRLKSGGADYTETAGGFTMVTAPATGTVLLVDYFIGGTINNIGTNSIISDETVTGLVNNSNTSYTTARPYIAGSLEVYVNGIHQVRGTDITETTPGTGVFTFAVAPMTGDVIRVNYQYNLNPASNSDTVDGIHASSTATANQLMPLDANAKFSANLLTNPTKFLVYRAAAQALVATTLTLIPYDTKEFDTGSNVDVVTNKGRFTAPVAGFYHLDISVGASAVTPTRMFCGIYKNGVEYKRGNDTGTTVQSVTLGVTVQLAAGDYIEPYYWSATAGGSMASQVTTHFSGYLVSIT